MRPEGRARLLEPLLLTGAGDLAAFARTVLLVHATTAVVLLAISLTRHRTA